MICDKYRGKNTGPQCVNTTTTTTTTTTTNNNNNNNYNGSVLSCACHACSGKGIKYLCPEKLFLTLRSV
jgi:hypothetical protein